MSGTPGAGSIGQSFAASPWIVRGEILDSLREAERIRADATAAADALRARAEAEVAAIRSTAHQEGLRRGAAAAASLLADAAAAAVASDEAREAELVPLAFAIAHRILGAFPEQDRVTRAVRTALEEHRGTSGLRLRADPHTAAFLRVSLEDAGGPGAILVEADEQAPPGRCTLVHPRGRVAIGPVEQLRTLFEDASGAARSRR